MIHKSEDRGKTCLTPKADTGQNPYTLLFLLSLNSQSLDLNKYSYDM